MPYFSVIVPENRRPAVRRADRRTDRKRSRFGTYDEARRDRRRTRSRRDRELARTQLDFPRLALANDRQVEGFGRGAEPPEDGFDLGGGLGVDFSADFSSLEL